jgi:hypothetical protein
LRQTKFHFLAFTNGDGDYQAVRNEIENKYADLVDVYVVPIYLRVEKFLAQPNHLAFCSNPTITLLLFHPTLRSTS